MNLFPNQEKALAFAKKRLECHRSAYLALAPGLGKTAVALTLARDYFRPLYICPPALGINLEREKRMWGAQHVSVETDSKLATLVSQGAYDLVIVDEAHRFKNPATARFKNLQRILANAEKILFLSGTPMPNSRPLELIHLTQYAPDIWPGVSQTSLANRYCDPVRKRFGRRIVWDYSGFVHEAEFYGKLQDSWMLRQAKEQINLPPKCESLVFVGKLPRHLHSLDAAARQAIKSGKTNDRSGHLATYRREIGLEKAKQALPWLKQMVEDSEHGVLVFCHHREVIEYLADAFKALDPAVILGGMTAKAKQDEVDRLQNRETSVAILSIGAAGVGVTLTEADRVIMLESSWLDGDNEQAGDRAHRIGQKKSVYVQHVVLEGSGDALFLETALKKRDLHLDNYF